MPYDVIEQSYDGKMYSDFKADLGDALVEYLGPLQNKYNEIQDSKIVLSEEEFLEAIPSVIYAIESYDTTTVRASVGNWLIDR